VRGPWGSSEELPEDTFSGPSGLLRAFRTNLDGGFRVAFLLPVRRSHFALNADQAVLLLGVILAIQLLLQYLAVEPTRVFNIYGVGNLAAIYLACVLGAYVVARIQKDVAGASAAIVAPFAGGLFIALLMVPTALWGLPALLEQPWSVTLYGAIGFTIGLLMVLAWVLIVLVRATRALYGVRIWHAIGLAALYAGIVIVPSATLPASPLWYTGGYDEDEAEGVETSHIDVERTFYAQPGLIDRAVRELAPQRPGTIDVYFVGFAGYGLQDVFLKEVRSATALFDERFDTRNRSVALINNPATVDNTPIASVSNLRLVLQQMGQRLDPDEDILFLFLTSHGSPDLLSVYLSPLELDQLTAAELKEMLDSSGIKSRVIVVSACYSGSFIDDLEDENSLIITAARDDRTSFGCSNENDYTYFGEAYFDQQLRQEWSFVDAFSGASRTIAEREKVEGLTPSEPQIYVGSAIRSRLSAFEQRIKSTSDAATN
jgi:hypothetical protein